MTTTKIVNHNFFSFGNDLIERTLSNRATMPNRKQEEGEGKRNDNCRGIGVWKTSEDEMGVILSRCQFLETHSKKKAATLQVL